MKLEAESRDMRGVLLRKRSTPAALGGEGL